jgi:hypothetical protein
MRPRVTVWLAGSAAVLGALVVTGSILVHGRADHEAIRADDGLPTPRPASTSAAPGKEPAERAEGRTSKRSPLAMALKDDGEDPRAAWPPGFHPTADRPTPLTMCLKHDTADGKRICPDGVDGRHGADARGPLAMPLR